MTEELETQVIESPEGEAGSPDAVIVETDIVGAPTTPEEDLELDTLQAAVDTATSPEAQAEAVSKRNKAFARIRTAKKDAETTAQTKGEEAAYWKGKAEALAERTAPVTETVTTPQAPAYVPPVFDKPSPQEGAFEDYADYLAAREDWVAEKATHNAYHKMKGELAEEQQRKTSTKVQEDQRNWEQAGEEKFPGFKEKVIGRLRPTLMGIEPKRAVDFSIAISESEKSHELAVFLADHPKDMNRLLSLTPQSMLREIGKLEDKLEKPQPNTTTKAPTPITPIKTGGEAITNLMDIKDDEEYFRQVKKKGRPY